MSTNLMDGIITGKPGLRAPAGAANVLTWHGPGEAIAFDDESVRQALLSLDETLFAVRVHDQVGIARAGDTGLRQAGAGKAVDVLAVLPPLPPGQLGESGFNAIYGTRYTCYGGAMASAIASTEMVIALGANGFLGSFGAAGLPPARLEAAIQQIQAALPNGPYAFNLIHSPHEEALERRAVELYLRYGVPVVEASAFLDLTPHIVHYRAAGLGIDPSGKIQIRNRVIAKLSRREVATKFMQPAPASLLERLVQEGKISELQASLAQRVPVADDVTVEAD